MPAGEHTAAGDGKKEGRRKEHTRKELLETKQSSGDVGWPTSGDGLVRGIAWAGTSGTRFELLPATAIRGPGSIGGAPANPAATVSEGWLHMVHRSLPLIRPLQAHVMHPLLQELDQPGVGGVCGVGWGVGVGGSVFATKTSLASFSEVSMLECQHREQPRHIGWKMQSAAERQERKGLGMVRTRAIVWLADIDVVVLLQDHKLAVAGVGREVRVTREGQKAVVSTPQPNTEQSSTAQAGRQGRQLLAPPREPRLPPRLPDAERYPLIAPCRDAPRLPMAPRPLTLDRRSRGARRGSSRRPASWAAPR